MGFYEKFFVENPKDFKYILISSVLLCLNAGCINAITYQGIFLKPSGHLTGVGTLLGMHLADLPQTWSDSVLEMGLFFSFTMGSIMIGILIPYESFKVGYAYGRVLLIESLILFLAYLFAIFLPMDPYYLFCASLACGFQNGMTTRYSGNVIRTTHITGTVTDIGLVIGRSIRGHKNEIWKLKLYLPMLTFFIFGGVLGKILYRKFKEHAFLINCGFTFLASVFHTVALSRRLHLNLWKALIAKQPGKLWSPPPSPGSLNGVPGRLRNFSFNGKFPSEITTTTTKEKDLPDASI